MLVFPLFDESSVSSVNIRSSPEDVVVFVVTRFRRVPRPKSLRRRSGHWNLFTYTERRCTGDLPLLSELKIPSTQRSVHHTRFLDHGTDSAPSRRSKGKKNSTSGSVDGPDVKKTDPRTSPRPMRVSSGTGDLGPTIRSVPSKTQCEQGFRWGGI